MMANKRDDQSPATKGDLQAVKHDLDAVKSDLAVVKGDISALRSELRSEMKAVKEEILHQFALAVETIRYDLLGANRDELETVKDRVTRLERHAGLVKAG